ncbi:hypothetical protein BBF93_09465 [Hyphomonas sp. CACIAM 19H1]|uniref:hypothetical protein n=1 Tax=Hyphomonas sp. CACIAM 19H1 TaxID=1873716 RepID=UPI000DED7EBC|nr:hypothetical protein [Hyphomonas sp. CACIAM 19H1]AXE64429.1 hypothetical protein BBF93_09465 [Hyphomonas sp. CACIAM 19H1]
MSPDIRALIETFTSGADTSITNANALEVALDLAYPENEYVQETVVMLAMYRPGGGEFLFDEEAICGRLAETLRYLEGK